MAMSDKIAVAGVGMLASMLAQRVVQAAWGALTGEEPPNPNDPDVPASVAFTWAIALSIPIFFSKILYLSVKPCCVVPYVAMFVLLMMALSLIFCR
ncbi:MAG: DUF4235 domain-containing protein, partial [Propionibacteriaceae bacterium]|nr:DUF4235 domain-containing protein [Propionibacteriaceae bacterium]